MSDSRGRFSNSPRAFPFSFAVVRLRLPCSSACVSRRSTIRMVRLVRRELLLGWHHLPLDRRQALRAPASAARLPVFSNARRQRALASRTGQLARVGMQGRLRLSSSQLARFRQGGQVQVVDYFRVASTFDGFKSCSRVGGRCQRGLLQTIRRTDASVAVRTRFVLILPQGLQVIAAIFIAQALLAARPERA